MVARIDTQLIDVLHVLLLLACCLYSFFGLIYFIQQRAHHERKASNMRDFIFGDIFRREIYGVEDRLKQWIETFLEEHLSNMFAILEAQVVERVTTEMRDQGIRVVRRSTKRAMPDPAVDTEEPNEQ